MPIYEKTTKELMREFASDRLRLGQVFTGQDAVDWFASHYPDIDSKTVSMHVRGMAVNTPEARRHHPSIRPGTGHDLFFKVARGQYRLWDPATDPPAQYPDRENASDLLVEDPEEQIDEELLSEEVGDGPSRQFAYENDLKNYLSKNISSLEPGLAVYQRDGITGIEFEAGGRFIDILAVDPKGDFVVIELKVSKSYDRVIGQLLRYVGWVRANLAAGKSVRGMIVASEISEDLKIAASEIPGVSLVEYEIAFALRRVTLHADQR